ncbi:bifunctional cytidylyltransferase/SDR family oxidoreductase [Pseudomonas delhiensis]|uniref:2-C-methyl-D-erythritol 4-phosphate cytidylyltransferase n=1 Tax=Pseudomonas delhiensis TaxID=366289 RepID=A0A239JCJ6_9PSED|nr:bifunctional cytidylyltransferase/SDR family oxidoreductase [Pseudomonas delhiensis]SDH96753.1 2-C-methyl-D-erythritol 4-phosphate cytidylyltransferase [Pseudomonas delhiensis]SNT03013.1 2-C-methyl-D-erythritol 4-phosphate cytidylyltransferase [Pseudomonas delhiensis]
MTTRAVESPVIAVVLAGGRGLRFGSELPKQFVKLAGRMVIEHTVEVFEHSPAVEQIVLVVPGGYESVLWEAATRNGWRKVAKIVAGGRDRADSTASAIAALDGQPEQARILIHDAARPLLDQPTIVRCLDALERYDAVDVVVPASDTIVEVAGEGHIRDIPDRSRLRRGQTPQGFRLGILREAYRLAERRGLEGVTCDCGVLRREMPEVTIATVAGSPSNLKITDGVDLYIAEKLIQIRSTQAAQDDGLPGLLRDRVVVVIGASYGIGASVAELARAHGARVHGASRGEGNIDISRRSDVERFLAEVAQREGRIDAVVNTAGMLLHKPLALLSESEVEQLIATNLTGTIHLAQAAHGYLRESRGCLVNFASSSYTRGRAFYAAYSATKAAVVNLTQALAEEWASEGIRVVCINPERTRTPMRTRNFGAEPVESLLDPSAVALATLQALGSTLTGMVFDVRRHG